MPKFRIHGTVVGSQYLGIYEAPTAEEAIEKAIAESSVRLCHHCSSQCEDGEISEATAEQVEE